jgi:prepilin-type N-terminal cleavage/methylation domain-containing protein/prepilin-type processing-associated H-X9-DG protein
MFKIPFQPGAHRSGHLTKRPSSAFTLIELLVVIAIIAILAAILFPVFGRARENARRSSCQSNVKQIMLGVIQYTQDYDENFPFGFQGTAPNQNDWRQSIYVYVKSTQVYVCPSDPNPAVGVRQSAPATASMPKFASSYLANALLLTTSTTPVHIAKVVNPSTTIFSVDGGAQANSGSTPENPSTWLPKVGAWVTDSPQSAGPGLQVTLPSTSNSDWAAPSQRHLDTCVVGFVDGHVKAMRHSQWYFKGGAARTPWFDPSQGGS